MDLETQKLREFSTVGLYGSYKSLRFTKAPVVQPANLIPKVILDISYLLMSKLGHFVLISKTYDYPNPSKFLPLPVTHLSSKVLSRILPSTKLV